jgi:preprotein translocase subunit SecE
MDRPPVSELPTEASSASRSRRIPPGLPEKNLAYQCIYMANKAIRFINEVKAELKKVSWPTKDELIGSTIVVLVTVALLSVFVGFFDLIFSRTINLLIR